MRKSSSCVALACVLFWIVAYGANAIEIVVHRGANLLAPENTRAAAQACIDLKADYVEVDVRTSKDGVMYILHDTNVDRTTNGHGPLHKLRSAEVDTLDAGSWFDEKFKGERVPRLDVYLRWIKGKAKVYFDVKYADLPKLLELVHEAGMDDACFYWFEVPARNAYLRQLAPHAAIKVNASTPEEVRAADDEWDIQYVEASVESIENPDFVSACRERGIKMMASAGDGSPGTFRRILESQADMVILDNLATFVKVRDGQSAPPGRAEGRPTGNATTER